MSKPSETPEYRQMQEMLIDLCAGMRAWDRFAEMVRSELPRSTLRTADAFRRRVRFLRAVVERAERLLP